MKRAPTEADAKERKQPIVVNLMVTVFPAVTGSPKGTGEAPFRPPVRGFSMGAEFVPQKYLRTIGSKKESPGTRWSLLTVDDLRVCIKGNSRPETLPCILN
jgi:hypothetical protein